MSLFQTANIQSVKNRYLIREERIKREGSPYYNYNVQVVAAAANVVIVPREYWAASRKYEPLDWAEIVNNDVVDLTACWNGNNTIIVLAGTIRYIEGGPIHQLRLTNIDGATSTTANKIRVTMRREPWTIDKWARRQQR